MPLNPSKRVILVDASSYCSAPPLATSSRILLPPRPTRAEEARRPHAPLRAVKAEVRESEAESVEFVFEDEEEEKAEAEDVKPKIELDPRQLSARVAAISSPVWRPQRPPEKNGTARSARSRPAESRQAS